MKRFLERYRNITVWLSLFILAMGFVAASDEEQRMVCMLFAFLAGAFLFGAGTAREWAVKNQPGVFCYAVLTAAMWMAVVITILRLGGIL